jgi:hypothetical protein
MCYNLIFKGHSFYQNIGDEVKPKLFELQHGQYRIKYNFYDLFNQFGYYPKEYNKNELYNWKDIIKIEIYDKNNLLHIKETNYTPCVNIYGDGHNPDNTFFTILENVIENDKKIPKFNIYDMNGICVKSISIYYNVNIDIKITKFNDKYYVIVFDRNILYITLLNSIDKFIGSYNDDTIILPLCGQNKMYVIQIKNNEILFNTNKICYFDNIDYELSKFLLHGNPLYTKNLLNNLYDKKDIKHYVITLGNFSAEFDYKDHHGRFDSNIGKFAKSTKVIFKEKGEIIFEMNSIPSIVIYGDGITREGTKFCIGSVSIYDMNQKLIRHTRIGSDSHHDIQRVNDKYAISTSIEVCTWTQFSGLIDLELFFSQTGEEEQVKPYDNARTYIPMCDDDVLYATCADEEGFILNNGMILKYEDAENFDFSNGDGYNSIDFKIFGYSDEQIKQIHDLILHDGIVSIPIKQ